MREVALVTGASSGIGLEITKILASQNYDLVICARREKELQDLAEEISRQHTVNCKVIVADLTTEEGVDLLIKDSGEIDILVNNAGFGILGDHLDMQLGRQLEMIELNIHALTRLSHVFGNLMVKKGKGRIMNVASIASYISGPSFAVYCATKAYVLSYSRALHKELKNKGVTVTALCPGYTATKMMDNPDQGATLRIPSSMMMSAKDVAEIGIKACFAGKDIVVPGLANKFTTIIIRLFSKSLLIKIFGSFYRKNMD
mgnify:CR=1 FL=1